MFNEIQGLSASLRSRSPWLPCTPLRDSRATCRRTYGWRTGVCSKHWRSAVGH